MHFQVHCALRRGAGAVRVGRCTLGTGRTIWDIADALTSFWCNIFGGRALLVGFAFLRKIFVLSLDIFEPLWSQTLSNAPTTKPLKSKMWFSAAVNCRSVPASTKATHANLIAKIEK